ELDELRAAAGSEDDAALAASFESLEDVVLDLHVPGEVVFARLEHRAGGGGGVPAALQLDLIEGGAPGHVIAGVELGPEGVAGPEVAVPVRPGAHRPQVGGRLA